MSTAQTYDGWKADDGGAPEPPPHDPHDQCERDIARLEAEVEAAKHAHRPLSFAELHALIVALLPGESFFVTVDVHHCAHATFAEDILEWRITYGFTSPECKMVKGGSAAAVYEALRAAQPRNKLDEVGELPW